MSTLLALIAVVVTVIAGWGLIKRYQTHMVLLFAGLAILICVALAGVGFLPKGVKPSGFWLFDIFATLKSIATKQSAGIGFLIMTAGGFAAYMDRIGAAKALVDVAVRPLSALKAPYLVLAFGYIVGQLLVALFPILKAVGVSAAAAAAVIGTSAGMTFAPTAGTASLAAKVANLDPIIYLVQYQLPLAVPTLIVAAVAHYFIQRHYDKKGDDQIAEVVDVKKTEVPVVPKWYALFPVLPIALLIVFSKLVVSSIKLDTIASLFMVWVFVVIVEIVRLRDVKKIFKDAMAMFQAMGKMFTGIVALIICAEFFATGLKSSGLIDMIINSANGVGAGMGIMTVVLTAIVSLVTFLTGSGVGAYSSFATLAPDVAAGFGGAVEALVTPMQFASGMIRAMSPVAGVIIAVAGAAGVSPMAIVRRTWIPMVLGLITTLVFNRILFG